MHKYIMYIYTLCTTYFFTCTLHVLDIFYPFEAGIQLLASNEYKIVISLKTAPVTIGDVLEI